MGVLNKTDLRKVSELSAEEKKLIESMKEDLDGEVHFIETSCATKDGVDAARSKACDLLLDLRVEQKVKQGKSHNIQNRITTTSMAAPTNRPACIPNSVVQQRAAGGNSMEVDPGEKGFDEMLEKERMEMLGGAGVYSVDLWRRSILEEPSWKYDVIPEIMDGHNVVDFVDPDIDKLLAELEREEELLLAESKEQSKLDDATLKEWKQTQDVLDHMHSRIRQKKLVNKLNKSNNHVPTPRNARKKKSEVADAFTKRGMDPVKAESVARGRSKSRGQSLLGKRKADSSVPGEGGDGSRAVSASRARSASMMKGLPSMEVAVKVEKKRRKQMRQHNKVGKKGEGDHHIPDMKPKHLFSGKRGIGKADRR